MAEACYSARVSTKTQVVAKIARLLLEKTENGQYTHGAITTLAHGIEHIMTGINNPCDTGKGMRSLLIQNAYRPKFNKAVTPEAVLKEAREAADKESRATGITVSPAFTLRSEAQKEAGSRSNDWS